MNEEEIRKDERRKFAEWLDDKNYLGIEICDSSYAYRRLNYKDVLADYELKLLKDAVKELKEAMKGEYMKNCECNKCECNKCEYMKCYRHDSRSSFQCCHPNQQFIDDYFKEHEISKMPGFIGFSKPWESVPINKTTPKWCPKKEQQ